MAGRGGYSDSSTLLTVLPRANALSEHCFATETLAWSTIHTEYSALFTTSTRETLLGQQLRPPTVGSNRLNVRRSLPGSVDGCHAPLLCWTRVAVLDQLLLCQKILP